MAINCGRCNALYGRIRKGTHKVIGPQGVDDYVCDECLEEINYIVEMNENEEIEEPHSGDS